mmetsp:Transcript_18520/g.22130  ORF Transcript_18520/g.22130 Transcript_18520/m.22130 type:complete len:515 (-) Transcript_18520:757-2301(-)|eukprot:CAMPEP_0198258254 /NCGR_PEP_ID=MMETSP1447-20131203/7733_1 /TAXON_ID=420782 /ORGANISM="Chaetoceros dichaeta, Strain CCMP1751" /LENGTH=514 /DNA_ID=CAMNT_0043945335 /DNA_START=48 /DNA_END=1592 /DNA_ORIENTATION=-
MAIFRSSFFIISLFSARCPSDAFQVPAFKTAGIHSSPHYTLNTLSRGPSQKQPAILIQSSRTRIAPPNSSASSSDASENVPSESSKQSMSSATFNLVKAIVGAGVLALPSGIAALGDAPSLIIPAALLMFILGSLSAYSFYMIGRLSHLDGDKETTNSLSAAWEQEVGENSAWVVSLSCFLVPLGAALTYSIMLGDMLSSLACSAGLKGFAASRQASILGITASVLFPLCNLKSLAALSVMSIAGVGGVFMTCLVMLLRNLPGGPYSAGGAFLSTVAPSMQPSFGIVGSKGVLSPSVLILVSMAATSYLAHFSAHDFYDGLKDSSKARFAKLTGISFSITAIVNCIVMSLGFLTFGGNCSGMILNNYSPKDIGASLCRIVTSISLIGSYPLFMRAIKSTYFELFQRGKVVTDDMNKKTTRAFLAFLTGMALILEDAGFMVGMMGAVMGSAIIYMFPSIIFLKLTSRLIKEGKMKKSRGLSSERLANKFMIGMGALLGILGGTATVLNTFAPGVL